MRTALVLSTILAVCLAVLPQDALADSPINFSSSLRVGFMLPETEEFEEVYDQNYIFIYGLNFGWKIVKDLELVGEAAYGFKDGKGIAESGEETGEEYRLHVVPAMLGVLYRLKFYENQPVVPYLGGGGNYTYYYEGRKEDSEQDIDGGKWGYDGFAGLEILLDNMDKRAAGAMETEFGINNVYLFYEFRYQTMDDFEDEGLDLTSTIHYMGLLFEY